MAIEKFVGNLSKEDGGCTILINETINLIQSSDALALYVYLACRPHTWDLNYMHIMKHFKWGKNKTYKILHYLQNLYLLKKIEHRQSGKIVKHEYILMLKPFSPLPQIEEVDKNHASTGFSPLHQNREVENKLTTSPFTRSGEMGNIENKEIKKTKINKNINAREALEPVVYQETYFAYTTQNSPSLKFEEFWNLYPVKKNKLRTYAMWQQKQLDFIADQIISKLKIQITQDSQWLDKFIPNPANYINDERWMDEIVTKPLNGSKNNAEHNTRDWHEKLQKIRLF